MPLHDLVRMRVELIARPLHAGFQLPGGELSGEKAVVLLESRQQGLADNFDRFRVGRAVYTVLADLIVCASEDRPPDADAVRSLSHGR